MRIRGLHVVDYSHTMYAPLQTDSFCYGRGFLDMERACYAHGEIHPYNYTGIVLDRPQTTACLGPSCAETRTFMVVAPFIPQIYSWTHIGCSWVCTGIDGRRWPVAVAASILTAGYHLLRDKAEYGDLGPDFFVRRDSAGVAERLAMRIRELGYEVQIQKTA